MSLSSDNGAGLERKGGGEILGGGDDADFAQPSKFGDGLNFGEHGAGAKIVGGEVRLEHGGGDVAEGGLVGLAVVKVDLWDGGDGYENVRIGCFGEFFGGKVLVDDSIDTE